ncbi:unnamed protein product, partial [Closterium sp. NIES-53]
MQFMLHTEPPTPPRDASPPIGHAVRCGHCKKLAPDYEKLASAFKKTKTVAIAKKLAPDYEKLASAFKKIKTVAIAK